MCIKASTNKSCVHLSFVALCSAGFHYPLYGKTAGREESEVSPAGRGEAASGKLMGEPSSSSSGVELLQQPSHQYRGKSPVVRDLSVFLLSPNE